MNAEVEFLYIFSSWLLNLKRFRFWLKIKIQGGHTSTDNSQSQTQIQISSTIIQRVGLQITIKSQDYTQNNYSVSNWLNIFDT